MRLRAPPAVLLALLAAAPFAGAQSESAPAARTFEKIAVLKLREQAGEAIDASVKRSILRRLEEAERWGVDCIVVDIESYGGYVDASIETADEIFAIGRRVHTIAYVGRKAISGAAMIAVSCREIVMSEAATLGDSQAIAQSPEGAEKAPEKIQTVVAATFRKFAEGNGYPVPLLEAMVRQEMEVVRFRRTDGTWRYFRSDTDEGVPTAAEREAMDLVGEGETVVHKDELATFTAGEALDYGICSRTEPSLDALLASLGKDASTEVWKLDWTWAERVSRWLLGIRWLLFLGGIGALYFALKMPGTGVPEALALLCFGLFFGASSIAGFAGAPELILFLVGIALIVVEIFLLPGFGVAGIAGLACLFGSIALASLPAGDVPADAGYFLVPMARDFLLGSFLAIAIAFFVARNLASVPFFRRAALEPPTRTVGGGAARLADRAAALVGKTGVAETQLRPSGTATIDGERTDVVAEGSFVPAGTPIRVVAVSGNRVVVRPESGAA